MVWLVQQVGPHAPKGFEKGVNKKRESDAAGSLLPRTRAFFFLDDFWRARLWPPPPGPAAVRARPANTPTQHPFPAVRYLFFFTLPPPSPPPPLSTHTHTPCAPTGSGRHTALVLPSKKAGPAAAAATTAALVLLCLVAPGRAESAPVEVTLKTSNASTLAPWSRKPRQPASGGVCASEKKARGRAVSCGGGWSGSQTRVPVGEVSLSRLPIGRACCPAPRASRCLAHRWPPACRSSLAGHPQPRRVPRRGTAPASSHHPARRRPRPGRPPRA